MPRAPVAGDWLSLLALTVLWGNSFLLNELALASFSPDVLVAGRIVIATLVLFVYMQSSGIRLPAPGRAWIPMLVMAIFGTVLPFNLIAWAQQHIDSSLAGVLMAAMPLFVLTLAHFFVPGARLTPYRAVGFVVGFAGVVIVIGPDLITSSTQDRALWGALAVLAAALSYSISTVYARRLGATEPVQLSVGMLIVASLLALPGAAADLPQLAASSLSAVAAMAVLGFLSTGFATLLYFRIVQGPGPTFLSFVNYLVPAWAVLAGALVLGESLTASIFIGLGCILCGIALSELGPRLAPWLRTFVERRPVAMWRNVAREDA